ncbi:uncharacterized protein LOC111310974 [Durio zibethinus]|uniref:Uncharacterized protein LOC111310974 n=1 Tax=Durio zibethinus TaxID=66656 RepID=A0A6P6AMR1_DURZI|nr:uncharacterized protein LOC111310974 [Durio zibethinus]
MSFFACRFLLSFAKSNTFNSLPKQHSLFLLAALTRSQLRFYSSEFHSTKDDDDVGKNELRMRIQKFFDGDEDAIPSIFEGILKRKLSGKHEESDDELMKEIRRERHQPLDDVVEQEFDSDLTDSSDTDGD